MSSDALAYLDDLNEEGRIEYDDYRNLHDLISAETPTDDERIVRASIHRDVDAIRALGPLLRRSVPEPSTDWYDLAVKAFPWDAPEGDAVLDARRRMVQVLTDNFPEPCAECPQCHRPDGLHKLGCGERFGSEPQGEPSDAALYAAFKAFRAHERKQEFNEFDELTCSECGYAYTWKAPDGRYVVLPRRRERHIAREALRAASTVTTPQGEPSDAQVNRDYLAQVIHKAVYSRIPLDDLTDEAQADTYKRADAVVAALRAAGGVR